MISSISHTTSIDGSDFVTKLNVGEDLADYLEIAKSDYKCKSDEEADAFLCKMILDSLKLRRNSKVRGKAQKTINSNREAIEKHVLSSNDADLFLKYRQAVVAGKRTEFLDEYGEQNPEVPGLKKVEIE